MEGIITAFRGSRAVKSKNQMLIEVKGIDSKEKAAKLTGKTVTWSTPGKKDNVIKGKISMPHGNKGLVRAIFEKGMPGQSLGTKVKIE
ncbi:50S ribosomal protein L35ae [Candidatus Woesearchaeota archaeon]|nr:50S ribosomal protein L35ae [Candidatus Woesearchaeota archaeon]